MNSYLFVSISTRSPCELNILIQGPQIEINLAVIAVVGFLFICCSSRIRTCFEEGKITEYWKSDLELEKCFDAAFEEFINNELIPTIKNK